MSEPRKTEGATSWRSVPRPAGWAQTAKRILERDQRICHVCKEAGADAVDHVISAHLGGSDDDDNLAAIHHNVSPYCHRTKTAREAAQAMHRKRGRRQRDPERHPGLKP